MTSAASLLSYALPNTNIHIRFSTIPASEIIGIHANIDGHQFVHIGQYSAHNQQWLTPQPTTSSAQYVDERTYYQIKFTSLPKAINSATLETITTLAKWFALKRRQSTPDLLGTELRLKAQLTKLGFCLPHENI